jgi:hypothetical protein
LVSFFCSGPPAWYAFHLRFLASTPPDETVAAAMRRSNRRTPAVACRKMSRLCVLAFAAPLVIPAS